MYSQKKNTDSISKAKYVKGLNTPCKAKLESVKSQKLPTEFSPTRSSG